MIDRYSLFFALLSLICGAAFVAKATGYFESVPVPVARVDGVQGTVRRLPHHDLMWLRVGDGALFGEGDTVSTGEGASTRLTIYGVGELELGPGSMVVLSGSQDALELNFVSGSAKLRKSNKAEKKISVTRDLAAVQRGPGGTEKTEGASSQKIPAKVGQAVTGMEVVLDDAVQVEAAPTQAEAQKIFKAEGATIAEQALPTLQGSETTVTGGSKVPGVTHIKADANLIQADSGLSVLNVEETAITAKKGEEVAVLDMDGQVLTIQKKIPVPTLRFPDNDEKLIVGLEQKIKPLAWESVIPTDQASEFEKPDRYYVFVQKVGSPQKPKLIQTKQPYLPARKVARRSGEYRWWVRSKSKSGKVSPRSEVRRVKLEVHANIKKPTILPVKVE